MVAKSGYTEPCEVEVFPKRNPNENLGQNSRRLECENCNFENLNDWYYESQKCITSGCFLNENQSSRSNLQERRKLTRPARLLIMYWIVL